MTCLAAAFGAPAAGATPGEITIFYSTGCTAYDVPDGAYAVLIVAIGANGADGTEWLFPGGKGGLGGVAGAFFSAAALGGHVYATAGSPGYPSGRTSGEPGGLNLDHTYPIHGGDEIEHQIIGTQGGDGSDARTGSCDGHRILVAGGGGAGGDGGYGGYGGDGGAGAIGPTVSGGDGAAGAKDEISDDVGAQGGHGGSPTEGGAGGAQDPTCDEPDDFDYIADDNGKDGGSLSGGLSGDGEYAFGGGAGGGGWFGGGGGAGGCSSFSSGAGGGGGSSYVDLAALWGGLTFGPSWTALQGVALVGVRPFFPPTLTFLSQTPPAPSSGWYLGPVHVTWLCQAGVVDSVERVLFTEGGNQSITGPCADQYGGVGAATRTGINIDLTPPQLALSHTADGLLGWNVHSPVTETITAGDTASGIAGAPSCTDGPVHLTLTAGAAGTWTAPVAAAGLRTISCSVTDVAGRSSNAGEMLRIDATAPLLALAHPADGTNGWNRHSPVVETITASDTGSGLAGPPACTDGATPVTLTFTGAGRWTVSIAGARVHSIGCTVGDVAGNPKMLTDTVKIDLTAPVITAASRTIDPTGATGITLTTYGFTADDTQDPAPLLVCTPAVPHTFAAGTTTTVKCTATDAAGNSSPVKSVTVVVRGSLALLQALNAALDAAVPKLGPVILATLHMKLNFAISYVSGKPAQACVKLAEFNARIAQERIDPFPRITVAQAATFTAAANLIRAVLRC